MSSYDPRLILTLQFSITLDHSKNELHLRMVQSMWEENPDTIEEFLTGEDFPMQNIWWVRVFIWTGIRVPEFVQRVDWVVVRHLHVASSQFSENYKLGILPVISRVI